MGRLAAGDPHVLVYSLESMQGVVEFFRDELLAPPPLLHKLLTSSGAFHRSLPTLRARAAHWRSELGFTLDQLLVMLERCPRLLNYPMHLPKYRQKLQFLTGGWWWQLGGGAWCTYIIWMACVWCWCVV